VYCRQWVVSVREVSSCCNRGDGTFRNHLHVGLGSNQVIAWNDEGQSHAQELGCLEVVSEAFCCSLRMSKAVIHLSAFMLIVSSRSACICG